jgi:hypothetical protein
LTLRPIGTTFDVYYPPSEYTTDRRGQIITYKVKEHTKSMRYLGDKEGQDAELLEVIKIVFDDGEVLEK